MRPHRAFTLIEMLLVVAIIALLLALLLPNINKAREAARDVECRSNKNFIGTAFITLSRENKGRLPGLWGFPWTGPNPLEGSFMGKEAFQPWYQPTPAAATGTIVPYVGGDSTARAIYRCPSLPVGVFRSGVGSNSMFDITMIQALPGARVQRIPHKSSYVEPGSGLTVMAPTPVVIEEDPAYGINKDFVDMGHTSINRFASTHFGNGGNYFSADGGAHRLAFPAYPGPQGWDWTATTGAGTTTLGNAMNYGAWR